MTSELLRWHAVFWWIQSRCRRACLYLLADVDDTGTHSGVRTHDPEWYAMHPRKKHCPELGLSETPSAQEVLPSTACHRLCLCLSS